MHDHIIKNSSSAPARTRGLSIDKQNTAHDPETVTLRSVRNVAGAVVRSILPSNKNRSRLSLTFVAHFRRIFTDLGVSLV